MTVAPTAGRLTSGYGVRPGRRTGAPTFHAGIDLAANAGAPVRAVAAGRVAALATDAQRRSPTDGYGNVVAIDHGNGWWTVYAHLSAIEVMLGEPVPEGKVLGRAGNTSNGKFPGMGAHLHFEVRDASRGAPFPGPYRRFNVDPEPWLRARGVEVRAQRRSGTRGLGDLPGLELLDMDAEGLPEEPVRDLDTYDPEPLGFLMGVTVGAGIAIAGAVHLIVQGWRMRRGA